MEIRSSITSFPPIPFFPYFSTFSHLIEYFLANQPALTTQSVKKIHQSSNPDRPLPPLRRPNNHPRHDLTPTIRHNPQQQPPLRLPPLLPQHHHPAKHHRINNLSIIAPLTLKLHRSLQPHHPRHNHLLPTPRRREIPLLPPIIPKNAVLAPPRCSKQLALEASSEQGKFHSSAIGEHSALPDWRADFILPSACPLRRL
ncbi:hypothetical protein BJ508DRAFT_171253 [Ascobolus immersus RN42]|uniref:Uncharacterized protein n=1 Tax=Ascobolus immersus RN42 TaxID=1160509 RepID=A0A3N4HZM3_ASCIM|nr:hypothetical protein BJ508DRAFT_171253 [Ascobolus immersus RN42]